LDKSDTVVAFLVKNSVGPILFEAGFTPEEAIQIMTGNGATALDLPDIGTIEVGKRADLLILNGDLKLDPKVIKKPVLVFKAGYGFDPERILKTVEGKIGAE